MIEIAFEVIRLVGIIAFIRGWYYLVHPGEQGGQITVGKGLTHIIGGIFAYHMGATVTVFLIRLDFMFNASNEGVNDEIEIFINKCGPMDYRWRLLSLVLADGEDLGALAERAMESIEPIVSLIVALCYVSGIGFAGAGV